MSGVRTLFKPPGPLAGKGGWLGLLGVGDKAIEAWLQGREAGMAEEVR